MHFFVKFSLIFFGISHNFSDLNTSDANIATSILQRNVKKLLKFCCKFCENLSEKLYALDPSSGNYGVKEEEETEDGKGVIFANIVPKRSRRSVNTCAKEKAGQRLAAVEVRETPAELRDSLQFQTISQSGLQKKDLVELEFRTYLKL